MDELISHTESANILKHFVTDEDGTTAVLATFLDSYVSHPAQREIQRRIALLLRGGGIDVPDDLPPSIVRPQYLAIDLVVTWGDWILLIENKVKTASITRNQLARYYRVAMQELSAGRFIDNQSLGARRIGVIYLTPTSGIGGAEFESLQLPPERNDRKLHMAWPDLLAAWNDVLAAEPADSPWVRLAQDGCKVIAEILTRDRRAKSEDTPHRRAAKKLLDEIQSQVLAIMQPHGHVSLSRWKSPPVDQLYGWLGGPLGNVYLTIPVEGSDLAAQTPIVHTVLSFHVANKAPKRRKREFANVPLEHWSRLLGVRSEELESPEDPRHSGVEFRNVWTADVVMAREQLVTLFCRFLITFRTFMEADGLVPPTPVNLLPEIVSGP